MTQLIDLSRTIPSIKIDIRYATESNFTGQKLYTRKIAFLVNEAAEDLRKVEEELELKNYGLVVWDAYRPWSITKRMWELSQLKNSDYIADPEFGSVHNRGCAVDLTLRNLATDTLLEMPTDFDNFTFSAHPLSNMGSEEQKNNLRLLVATMKKHNFLVDEKEWWHFNWHKWGEYPILDINLESL